MKLRILFIINPVSGVGKQKVVEELIPNYLNLDQFDYEIAYTQAPGHASEISGKAAEEGFDIVVAVGGDGTVNEVSRGLVHTNTALAIIPAGSGNGLALFLKIPLDLKVAIANINQLRYKKIDTVTINDKRFVNVAGIGFDAHISHKFAVYGKRGFLSYAKLSIREYFSYKSKKYRLIIDGKSMKKRAFLITFANSSQWGNNVHIAPNAVIDDGLIDICFMKKFPLIAAPIIAFRMLSKKMDKSHYMKIVQGKSIEVFRKKPMNGHIDGEPVSFGTHLMIDIDPLSLNILTGDL